MSDCPGCDCRDAEIAKSEPRLRSALRATSGEASAPAARCRSAIDNRLDQSGTAKGFGNLLRGKLAA